MKIVAYYPVFGGKYKKHLEQRELIAEFAEKMDHDLVDEFAEKESGLVVFRKAMAKAKKTGSALVFSRIAYLSRNLKFLRVLAEGGPDLTFIALDDENFSPATFPHYVEQAKEVWHERRNKVKDGMAEAKKNGAKFGARRPGAQTKNWKKAQGWKKAIAQSAKARAQRTDDAYALLIPKIIEMRRAGEGWPAIANYLNEAGHVTTTGAPFSAPTVLRIIKRHARQGGQGDPARREGMGRPPLHAAAHR